MSEGQILQRERIRTFTDLVAWQETHKLVLLIYQLTKSFPKSEMFGLVSQMRRSAVSVTSNIAEGFSRQSSAEKTQFYYMSKGSLTELQNQLIVARDVGYLTGEEVARALDQAIRCQKLINGLIKSLRSPPAPNTRY